MIAPLALALLQDGSKPRAPDAALYDALIKKTNDLKAFVAEYRIHVPGSEQEGTLKLAFRAPSDLRVDMDMPSKFILQLRDGVFEVSGSPSGKAGITAHVPIGDFYRDRHARLTEALLKEFPESKKDWVSEPDCGATFQLDVTPSKKDEKEDFQFQATYTCHHTALLGWLEFWKSQEDARFDGEDALALTTARGAKLRLSTRTGFVERIEKEKEGGLFSFALVSLDLDPKFDAKSFEMPPPEKGAEEASAPFSAQMQQVITIDHRAEVCRWVARHVSEKTIAWNDETRGHVRKVLECVHSDALAGESGPLVEGIKGQLEGFGKQLAGDYGKIEKTDGAARGELDAKVDTQRKALAVSLQKLVDRRNASLSISEKVVPDDSLRDDLAAIEKEAADAAFARVVQEPLLEAFDDAVSKAKGGG